MKAADWHLLANLVQSWAAAATKLTTVDAYQVKGMLMSIFDEALNIVF